MADPVPLVANTPTPATNPVPDPIAPPVPQSETSSSKSMMWVIVAAFILVAVLVGAGIYMYMMARETNPEFQQISQNIQESLDSAANDLAGVQDNDVSADFAEVDKELSQL